MATFVNDLRLTELATGEGSGSWGVTTNTNLSLIGESFSFGTEAITTNADTHTTTIADGSTDPGRSLFLKYTGTLDSACTITIGPNTVSKLWFIENATSGGFSIIISQGSGANITIPNGQTKAIYSDGAGSGAAMVDAFQDLSIPDLFVDDDLTVGDDLILSSDGAIVKFGADADTTLTHTDGSGLTLNSTNKIMFNDASQFIQGSSATVLSLGATDEIDLTATAIDVNGTIDVSGNATLGGTLGVTGAVTADAGISIDNITIDGTEIDLSSGDLTIDVAGDIILDAEGTEIKLSKAGTQFGKFATDIGTPTVFEISSSVSDGDIVFKGNDGGSGITALTLDMSAAGAATFNDKITAVGTSVFTNLDISGDVDVDGTTNLDVVDIDGAVDMASTLTLAGNADFNGNLDVDGSTSLDDLNVELDDNASSPVTMQQGSNSYFKIVTTNSSETVELGNTTTNPNILLGGGTTYIGGETGPTLEGLAILAGNENGGIQINRESGTPSSGEGLGSIAFKGQSSANTNAAAEASISAFAEENFSGSTAATNLRFSTKPSGTGPGSGPTERARITSGGQFLLGTTASRTLSGIVPNLFQEGTGYNSSALGLVTNVNDAATAPLLLFGKSRGTSDGSSTVVQSGDRLGGIFFTGADGTDIESLSAVIQAKVDGTPGSNDMPGRLEFYTTPDGSEVTVERVRIDSTGAVRINNTRTTSTKLHVVGGTTSGTVFDTAVFAGGQNSSSGSGARIYLSGTENDPISRGTIIQGEAVDNSNAHALVFKVSAASSSPSEGMRLNQQNLGIGTTAPESQLHVAKSASGARGPTITLDNTAGAAVNNEVQIAFLTDSGASVAGTSNARIKGVCVDAGNGAADIRFHTWNGSAEGERMRLNSNGLFGVGTTLSTGIAVQSSDTGVQLDSAGRIFQTISDHNDFNRTANGETIRFRRSATQVGSISVTASATAYNTSSDYRLKENITDLTSATDRLKQLAPKRFNFKADADTIVDGFIAHEVSSIVPESITGEKDGVDDDGNPVYQGIDQSKLVPLLVATIKELEARIAALESE